MTLFVEKHSGHVNLIPAVQQCVSRGPDRSYSVGWENSAQDT